MFCYYKADKLVLELYCVVSVPLVLLDTGWPALKLGGAKEGPRKEISLQVLTWAAAETVLTALDVLCSPADVFTTTELEGSKKAVGIWSRKDVLDFSCAASLDAYLYNLCASEELSALSLRGMTSSFSPFSIKDILNRRYARGKSGCTDAEELRTADASCILPERLTPHPGASPGSRPLTCKEEPFETEVKQGGEIYLNKCLRTFRLQLGWQDTWFLHQAYGNRWNERRYIFTIEQMTVVHSD